MYVNKEVKRLKQLYARTKNRRFLKAAAILLGEPAPPGQSEIDDRQYLVRVAHLIYEKMCASEDANVGRRSHAAARQVAEEIGGRSVDATAQRLYKKFRKQRQFYMAIAPWYGTGRLGYPFDPKPHRLKLMTKS